MINPFPGLRPFETDEDHLFFGRERDIDALLGRLRATRFLAVIGASGSGKSSLVRSGLIPALESGFMAGAGSSWRVAILRPGEEPIGHLADALNADHVLGQPDDFASTRRVLLDATLRRGTSGLVSAVRQSGIPSDHNLLVLVDQFEEIFRFRRGRLARARDESIAFIRLLLEAAHQQAVPIFVVLTMRSDFLGDCTDFPGLPDAINDGLYLVGRMSRESLRSAVTGPVAVAGGTIAPRLVTRVLNDLGDDQDQLPRVQHALMRTWDYWSAQHVDGDPLDVAHYEAIGALGDALSRHAEEAWREAVDAADEASVAHLFKALTDRHSDVRGVRRPASVAELSDVCGVSDADVIRIVDVFRRPGRSFLMPPSTVTLTPASMIDLSHESLMRCWTRLITWADEEAESADFYLRLSKAAEWHAAGKAGLWRHPELRLAERWREDNRPTEAWARRYDEGFGRAMAFLDESLEAHRQQVAQTDRERRATLRRTQWTAALLASLLVVAAAMAWIARRESARASKNLALAREAVDESLSSVDLDPARLGADVPALEELRRDLLTKAQRFYVALGSEQPTSPEARQDLALAHLRLGHINRLMGQPEDAAREYADAVTRFDELARESPATDAYREGLADASHWIGETLRPQPTRVDEAMRAYDRALALQKTLAAGRPGDTRLVRQLARTHYDRGILFASKDDGHAQAEADFRAAVTLLEPQAATDVTSSQELARALNNLASVINADPARLGDARRLFERAIALDEQIVAASPDNRESRLELAKYDNNLAALLSDLGQVDAADARSVQAIELLDGLARLAPSLAIERADAHTLRGRILQAKNGAAAVQEYARALTMFESMTGEARLRALPDFHQRFGDLLLELAEFPNGQAANDARLLRDRAFDRYRDVTVSVATSGSLSDARTVAEHVTALRAQLPAALRIRLAAADELLRRRVDAGR